MNYVIGILVGAVLKAVCANTKKKRVFPIVRNGKKVWMDNKDIKLN